MPIRPKVYYGLSNLWSNALRLLEDQTIDVNKAHKILSNYDNASVVDHLVKQSKGLTCVFLSLTHFMM